MEAKMSIIRRMDQLKDICRLIVIIEEETKKLETQKKRKKSNVDTPEAEVIELFDSLFPYTSHVITEFSKKHSCTEYQARQVMIDAVNADERYVETFGVDYEPRADRFFSDYVQVTSAGRTLNGKTLRIPTGLYNKWLEDNDRIVAVLLGGGITAIATAIALLIKAAFEAGMIKP